MRAPLILLIVLFAISVFGLTLVPGTDSDGKPWRMDVFDAFYFMSYTATTIGFGEIPHSFSPAQRMWVIVTIYLSVIAWAYAIGTVLALLQDRGFRDALALQRFGRDGAQPARAVPASGRVRSGRRDPGPARSMTWIAASPWWTWNRPAIDALDLAAFRYDVPGYAGDASNPEDLVLAGLNHPSCAGVIAMTNDDEANLAVVMTAALLRPDLPVVARTIDPDIDHRMHEFGHPIVIDPFNLFGDELMHVAAGPGHVPPDPVADGLRRHRDRLPPNRFPRTGAGWCADTAGSAAIWPTIWPGTTFR